MGERRREREIERETHRERGRVGEKEREREIRVAEWLGTVTLIWVVCGSIPKNGGFFL